MSLKKIWISTLLCCAFVAAAAPEVRAEDWLQKSFKVIGDGTISFEFPESWGKKPTYKRDESTADITFGPYGPKSKPVFMVHVQAQVAVDPISDGSLKNLAKTEVDNFRNSAFETDIPISDFDGANVAGHYFSITDRESKRGEFDYLTMAVISSGRLLVRCYFFSSDGAPDFGADAMQMMKSINYTAPEPKPDK